MSEKKIHVIGYDEIVLLLGLLGIDGTIIENSDQFMKKFEELTKDDSIGMIIIALDLPDEIIDFIVDFKLNKRIPFVYILPDIFKMNIQKEDAILNKIRASIKKIIM
ncbi:MAG: hypothetical protein EU539_04490 [Promethearchaeota archaeon]|nr:MAG: hypothetical protein EU539_04490 [Candidatus Lokiarchaeota archaeon]